MSVTYEIIKVAGIIFDGVVFRDDLSLLFHRGLIRGQGTLQVDVDVMSGSQ
jgi:hypothetical protein